MDVVDDDEAEGGRRRDLALGRERKPGQVWGVGGPVRAKICFYFVSTYYRFGGKLWVGFVYLYIVYKGREGWMDTFETWSTSFFP